MIIVMVTKQLTRPQINFHNNKFSKKVWLVILISKTVDKKNRESNNIKILVAISKKRLTIMYNQQKIIQYNINNAILRRGNITHCYGYRSLCINKVLVDD